MTAAMQFVIDHAIEFDRQSWRCRVKDLADALTAAGHRTPHGKTYKGKRGTRRLVAFVYRRLKRDEQAERASAVARVFTRENGKHAY